MGKKETYLKYLATTSGLFFLSVLLIKFFDFQKNIFNGNTSGLLITELVLFIVGALILAFYWFIKFFDIKKDEYKLTKKEKIYFLSALCLYILTVILTFIFIITAHFIVDIKVVFYIFLTIILLFLVTASVFEMISRLGYQSYVAKKEYEQNQKLKKEKIRKILQENKEMDKSEIEKIVNSNKKRTKEAEEILKVDAIKKSKDKNSNPFKD
ncbi:hypothetical protein CK556_01800 [Mesoplasma chauliocola]|uniref:Uncharacterized protein n=1 Tax=Mesoplasma chauliocola TaxID=216427 RepID=A0A249SN63_9MOLU|nr:MFS transporter [Mesoplasma chauliocola]ASZ09088.1 hypothetical protein CK556_01800 [Mesoplasma chauliocola]